MTWYEDHSECCYFGAGHRSSLRAVGWLERNQPYSIGEIEMVVYRRLCELLVDPWEPMSTMGVHTCDLCQFEGESGHCNVFIPGEGFLYVAPELIKHYINAHGYRPPDEFCSAVLSCPPMKSMEYLRAILKNGGRSLQQFSHKTE